ncbi:MAG: DHA2 family efflux MFS transporter permease subunit [Candidatus Azobacteroides sp.]|nr:DHA2 family efflux MFS transporter permease subunit [Candidatus Azobacteroides sp.]
MRQVSVWHRIRRNFRNRDSFYHPRSPYYKWFVLANVMLGTFMAVLDGTIVNVGLPKIMASLGVSLDTIQWVITAYMLAVAAMLPTSGWLADKFGYKKVYFLGLLLFTIGSLCCAMSHSELSLISSRILQGLGGGIVQTLGMAIIVREFPPSQRGVALGFWSIASAASVSFGPLIGGYLVDNFGWQLIFEVNVPVGIFALFFTMIIQREVKNPNMRKFDLLGFISVSTFLPVLLYALTEGNAAANAEGWGAPYILLCFAISGFALITFIARELTTTQPLIDLRLLKNHNFGLANLFMLIFGMGMFGSTFLLPLYLQNSMDYTALQSGAVFLPVGIIQGFIAPLVGITSDKANPKIPIIMGISLLSLSFLANTHFSFMSEHHYIMVSLYLRGFGMGMIFTPLSSLALLTLPPAKMAQASSLINTMRQIGGSFGIAVFTTLLTARTNFHSQIYGAAINSQSETLAGVTRNMSYFIQEHGGSSLATAMRQSRMIISSHVNTQAFIDGINDDFRIACYITILGLIPALLMYSRKKVLAKNNGSKKV